MTGEKAHTFTYSKFRDINPLVPSVAIKQRSNPGTNGSNEGPVVHYTSSSCTRRRSENVTLGTASKIVI